MHPVLSYCKIVSERPMYLFLGIDSGRPEGANWKHVPGKLKYISCGALGCWGVNSIDDIYYLSGVSNQNCAGTNWHHIQGKLKQIEV